MASLQATASFTAVDDAGVVDAITAAAREQNAMCGRELAAIGELYARRAPQDDSGRLNWAIDGHENVVAEVAAALGISRGRARGRLRYAIALRERLPRIAQVFARGLIDFRLMAAVVSRTELVENPDLIAKLDAAIARHAPKWMRLSEPKLVRTHRLVGPSVRPGGQASAAQSAPKIAMSTSHPRMPGWPGSGRSCMPLTARL